MLRAFGPMVVKQIKKKADRYYVHFDAKETKKSADHSYTNILFVSRTPDFLVGHLQLGPYGLANAWQGGEMALQNSSNYTVNGSKWNWELTLQ